MKIARAPRAAAFDAAVRVPAEAARKFYEAGYRTVFRYVDRIKSNPDSDAVWPYNLTRPELAELLEAGLYVALVQYFSTTYESTYGGARYSYEYGKRMGETAAHNARKLGAPQGVAIFNDLEYCAKASENMVLDYCDGWSESVLLGGYEPGLYVGSGIGTNIMDLGQKLYGLKRYRSYWRAASAVVQIPHRGYCVIQGTETNLFGVACDQDLIALDHGYYSDKRRGDKAPGRFWVIAP